MKRLSIMTLISLIATILLACGSMEEKKEPETKTPTTDPNVTFIKTSNDQLANYPVAGFGYKSSKVPPQQWDAFAKNAAPVIKQILSQIPDGYVLQVTGHSDSRGPEEPTGNKPGNIKISTDRAKAVYNALVRNGITSPKMVFKGVGSSEPIEGIEGRDPRQRRVTFKVVPK